MTLAWNRSVASALLPVLFLLAALASGCGGNAEAESAAAESAADCGCYTSSAHQYGTPEGKAALKRYLQESAAANPVGSEEYKAYSRALARFSELEALYSDESLTPEDRWVKALDKLKAFMKPTETNQKGQETDNEI